MDRGAWQATVHGVSKSCIQLSKSHTHTHTHTLPVSFSSTVQGQGHLEEIPIAFSGYKNLAFECFTSYRMLGSLSLYDLPLQLGLCHSSLALPSRVGAGRTLW